MLPQRRGRTSRAPAAAPLTASERRMVADATDARAAAEAAPDDYDAVSLYVARVLDVLNTIEAPERDAEHDWQAIAAHASSMMEAMLAKQRDPLYKGAAMRRNGMLQWAAGDREGGVAWMERAFETSPDNLSNAFALIQAYVKADRKADTVEVCKRASKAIKGKNGEREQRLELVDLCLASHPDLNPEDLYSGNIEYMVPWASKRDITAYNEWLARTRKAREEAAKPFSVNVENRCRAGVELYFGPNVGSSSGYFKYFDGMTTQPVSVKRGDRVWLVDRSRNGITYDDVERGNQKIMVSSSCTAVFSQ
jgi:hypothetical protein